MVLPVVVFYEQCGAGCGNNTEVVRERGHSGGGSHLVCYMCEGYVKGVRRGILDSPSFPFTCCCRSLPFPLLVAIAPFPSLPFPCCYCSLPFSWPVAVALFLPFLAVPSLYSCSLFFCLSIPSERYSVLVVTFLLLRHTIYHNVPNAAIFPLCSHGESMKRWCYSATSMPTSSWHHNHAPL